MSEYPAPWWFRLLSRWFPDRCREIPEATEPARILIRQFAIIKRFVYLQQFASAENPEWYHTHPWKYGTIAIGLWGRLSEARYAGPEVDFKYGAPYFRYMGPNFIHQSRPLGPGHTSIFIGLGPKTDEKFYLGTPDLVHWTTHIKRLVKRL